MAHSKAMARSALRSADGYGIDPNPIQTRYGKAWRLFDKPLRKWALRYLRGRR